MSTHPEKKTRTIEYWACDCDWHSHDTEHLADRCIKVGQYRDMQNLKFSSIAIMLGVSIPRARAIYQSRQKQLRFVCESGHSHRSEEAKRKCERKLSAPSLAKDARNDEIYFAVVYAGERKSSVARRLGISPHRASQIVAKGLRITTWPGFSGDKKKPYTTKA